MSNPDDDRLLEILAAHHEKIAFIWNAVDHFILAQQRVEIDGDDVACVEFWKPTLARLEEISQQEPVLNEIWAVAGEEVSFDSPFVMASSAHAAVQELALLIDIGMRLSRLTAPAAYGGGGWSSILEIPDDVFQREFLRALENTVMPSWEASQRLRVKLDREFAKAKLHLDVLRRGLQSLAPKCDSQQPGVTDAEPPVPEDEPPETRDKRRGYRAGSARTGGVGSKVFRGNTK
jgi:hypothetical protein